MKKSALIKIKGIQTVEGENDTTELFTHGIFYKKNNNYYISYDESETTGFSGSKTILEIEDSDKLTLSRTGDLRSHLIVQKGKRNVGYYGTQEGELIIGVNTKEIKIDLNDDGGDLYFSYSLDINSSLISQNEVFVNIKVE